MSKWNTNQREKYFQVIFKAQGNKCAICGALFSRKWAVDHDHTCKNGGKSAKINHKCDACVRGVLCMRCNNAIGLFHDDISLLAKAIEYLEIHKHKKASN